MKRPITFKPALALLIGLFLFCLYNIFLGKKVQAKPIATTAHTCIYKLCPYKGDLTFNHGCGACEPGTDCYLLDSLHFVYPDKDYDYLDSLLFTPVK